MSSAQLKAGISTSHSVRSVKGQDGSVLLDIDQGICYTMNPVGARIWEMLKSETPSHEIVRRLAAEFQVPQEQVGADVNEFIENLRMQKLLVVTADEAKDHATAITAARFGKILSGIRAWYADKRKRK